MKQLTKKELANILINNSGLVQINVDKLAYNYMKIGDKLEYFYKEDGSTIPCRIISKQKAPREVYTSLNTDIWYTINVQILMEITIKEVGEYHNGKSFNM